MLVQSLIMVRNFGILLIICPIIGIGVLLCVCFFVPNLVKADTDDNVTGWAWSETIGWISFNCTDRGVCGTSDYGVNIDGSGNFSGYAWSENIGWINFAPSSGYPAVPNYSAKYNSGTGKVTGWARAEANGGGWDGWILLGKEAGGWSDQVTIDSGTKDFEGWAWGSFVVGWISFNCTDQPGLCPKSSYKVTASGMNLPPTATCDDNEVWAYCSDSRHPELKWNYSDPEGNDQESYQVQIDVEGSSDFIPPLKLDTGEVFSSGFSYTVKAVDMVAPGDDLDWDTLDYYWRVKVKDDQGNWSGWCSPTCDFDTPHHPYPDVSGEEIFTWSPENPSAMEPVQFTDNSECYDDIIIGSACSEGGLADSFKWTIPKTTEGDPLVIPEEIAAATFSEQGDWEVTLEVTDSYNYKCSGYDTVNIGLPLPEWKEVKPK